jgi:putative ABC transport system ATP-binding protein
VELPLVYLKRDARERADRVREVLERAQIDHRRRHYPRQLSGGQQQRVSIARAIVTDPQLILADEPTGNLDSRNGAEIMNLLAQLHRGGTTIVMVTHSSSDAGFSERTVRLRDGKIVAADPCLGEQTAPRHTVQAC